MYHALAFVQSFFTDVRSRLENEDRGATAVEYGLMVGLIAVAIIATLLLLGPQLNVMFTSVLTGLTPATTP